MARLVTVEVEGVKIRLTKEQVEYIDEQKSKRPKITKLHIGKKTNQEYWNSCDYPQIGFSGDGDWSLVLFKGYGVGHKVSAPNLQLKDERYMLSGWLMNKFEPIEHIKIEE